jgi:hypothetical protein
MTVCQLNGELSDLCRKRGVAFLSHEALWQVEDYGKLDPNILADNVHFSQLGLGLYLRETKEFLVGARTTGGGHKKDKTREDKAARHAISENYNTRSSYADVVAERQRAPRDDRDTARPVTAELRTDPPPHPTNGSRWMRTPPPPRGPATRDHGESQGTGDYYSAYEPPRRGFSALNVRDPVPQTSHSPDAYDDRYHDGAPYSGWAAYPEF